MIIQEMSGNGEETQQPHGRSVVLATAIRKANERGFVVAKPGPLLSNAVIFMKGDGFGHSANRGAYSEICGEYCQVHV